jgi:hypothetical protein
MQVSVTSNIDEVLAGMKRRRDAVVTKAIPLALNRCAEMARTNAARVLVAAGYRIPVRFVKAAIKITKATPSRHSVTIRFSRQPIPLFVYGARQTRDGVSVQVKGQRKRIKSAFVATMPSGHIGVFVRKPDARHKPVSVGGHTRSSALPIRELFGPSIGGAFATETVRQALLKSIEENFKRRLAHEIKRLAGA